MEAQQKAYGELITCITPVPVLKYFDVNDDIIVSVDASSEGLGACLLQGEQPVAYASRSLNSDVRNCALIEKEMLAIFFGTSKFVVLVDYYSKYFELTQLKDRTSASVINCLKQHMSRHGIPEVLHSDNGPEFSSLEFQRFAKQYQFQHVTSSPRFPQSNGLVERTVQTAKKLLKKAYEDNKDPYLAILELRNTPIPGVGLSSTQLLMGRRTRRIIPIKNTLLKPMAYDPSEGQRLQKEKQQVQKTYFDQRCRSLEPLKPGDSIRVQQIGTWEPAVLLERSDKDEPRSYIVKVNDYHYRRNRRNILKTQETLLHEDSSSEVAGDTNSIDPVANQLPNHLRDESDSELTSAISPIISRVSGRVIRVPLRY